MKIIYVLYYIFNNFHSGIDSTVANNILKMVDGLFKEQKICPLIMDEVAIRKELGYNKANDKINISHNRADAVGGKCLFVMLKSIVGNWKTILSYYVVGDLIGSEQVEI